MYYLKRDKKDEELGHGFNMFHNLDKTMVLQEARMFNETPVNAKKCALVLTKILYIVNQSEPIGIREATECFFATTKLFQSKEPLLRRMVYLVIKDLAPLAQDVIIVTSSLTKDMTGREDLYRGPAIRTLCSITDHTMMQAIERYMKQAIVDKNHSVASAALTSSMHLCKHQGLEIVKRWVNEIQEAINSDNVMVQYLALGLLYQVKKSDRLAISKLFSKFCKGSLRSPYAYILLIRITCQLIAEDEYNNANSSGPYFDFLESCLRHKSEAVVFEAASALISVPSRKDRSAPAVAVLQLFCGSGNAATRFAAVKALNAVAMKKPSLLSSCNAELESMITDSNRTVSTLAITTLLKIGSESCIDRLMKQISTYISEISDPFKITIVEAIRSLCLKFPRKHSIMMNFLSSMLRDEGGYEYKRAIVNTIIAIIQEIPEAKETGLAHLCEFIEDCEHSVLAVKILHLLGKEGCKTPQPTKYIRYIYNRVILEAPAVRAAAVSALAKFALYCEDLRGSVKVLLERCLMDQDDEVRDRATYYLRLLDTLDGGGEDNVQGVENSNRVKRIHSYIDNETHISAACLEKSLLHYLSDDHSKIEPFDFDSVPIEAEEIIPAASMGDDEMVKFKRSRGAETEGTFGEDMAQSGEAFGTGRSSAKEDAVSRESLYMEQLSKIAAFSTLGPLFKSCQPVYLTEEETEYVVKCTKHMFTHYVVFQFDINNTLTDQVLESASIEMVPGQEQFEVIKRIPAKKILPAGFSDTLKTPYSGKVGHKVVGDIAEAEEREGLETSYSCVRMPKEEILVTCTFNNIMKFKVKEYDASTGEISETAYEDEYTVNYLYFL
ncbi:unnamed protein product [Gordionus sp. m RMFG-2023]